MSALPFLPPLSVAEMFRMCWSDLSKFSLLSVASDNFPVVSWITNRLLSLPDFIAYLMVSPSRSMSLLVLESLRSSSSLFAMVESRTSMVWGVNAGSLSLIFPTFTWNVFSVFFAAPL